MKVFLVVRNATRWPLGVYATLESAMASWAPSRPASYEGNSIMYKWMDMGSDTWIHQGERQDMAFIYGFELQE